MKVIRQVALENCEFANQKINNTDGPLTPVRSMKIPIEGTKTEIVHYEERKILKKPSFETLLE